MRWNANLPIIFSSQFAITNKNDTNEKMDESQTSMLVLKLGVCGFVLDL